MLFRFPFRALGSSCEFLIRAESYDSVKDRVQTALNEISRLEAKYSFFRPESYLSCINAQAHHTPVALDAETQTLLAFAHKLYQDTHGRFDVTIGSIRNCWDFSAMALPDPQQLRQALQGVGWPQVEWAQGAIRLPHPATRLDLGGIVKEYAVDCAVGVLEVLGVESGLVNLGGDLRLVGGLGQPPRPWSVGVAHPRQHGSSRATLSVKQGAVVTSGDYQRYFIRDGVRHHHLLNPADGLTLPLDFSSATAHAATAMEASRLATRLILLGKAALGAPPPTAYLVLDNQGEPAGQAQDDTCEITVHQRI